MVLECSLTYSQESNAGPYLSQYSWPHNISVTSILILLFHLRLIFQFPFRITFLYAFLTSLRSFWRYVKLLQRTSCVKTKHCRFIFTSGDRLFRWHHLEDSRRHAFFLEFLVSEPRRQELMGFPNFVWSINRPHKKHISDINTPGLTKLCRQFQKVLTDFKVKNI